MVLTPELEAKLKLAQKRKQQILDVHKAGQKLIKECELEYKKFVLIELLSALDSLKETKDYNEFTSMLLEIFRCFRGPNLRLTVNSSIFTFGPALDTERVVNERYGEIKVEKNVTEKVYFELTMNVPKEKFFKRHFLEKFVEVLNCAIKNWWKD